MISQILLLSSLAATDILVGIQSLGVFWLVFAMVAIQLNHFTVNLFVAGANKIRWMLFLVLLSMMIVGIFSPASKQSSVAYAALFFVYGFWLISSLGSFRIPYIARAMKIVIGAYFLSGLTVTLTQVFGNIGYESFPFSRLWVNANSGEVRPIGFTSEPSYAAFIIVLAWVSLVRLERISPGMRNGFLFWTGLTLISLQLYGSIYGYLLGFVVILASLSLLSKRMRINFLFGGVLLGLIGTLLIFASPEEMRSVRILKALTSGDLDAWLMEDASSFFRFGPLFGYISSANYSDLSTWFGHGASSASYFFAEMFRLHIDAEKDGIELGLMPSFIYDYGLITGALLLRFLYRITQGSLRPAMIAIIGLLIFNANFSTQMIWFAITCGLLSCQSFIRSQSS